MFLSVAGAFLKA